MRFEGKDDTVVELKKQRHRREGNDIYRKKRLREAVTTLEQYGVKPTYAKLRELGFGGRVISMWSKERKVRVQ